MQYLFWTIFAIGILLLILTAINIIRTRHTKAIGSGIFGVLFCIIGGFGLSFLLNYYTYTPFSTSEEVATVTVSNGSSKDDSYQVVLTTPDHEQQEYFIQGKEWELDARILNWDGLMEKLGIAHSYRLEKLSTHSVVPSNQNSQIQTIYELSDNSGFDFAIFAYNHPNFMPLVNMVFGSAVYMPLSNGAQYAIFIGTDGLIAKPINKEAKDAIQAWEQQ